MILTTRLYVEIAAALILIIGFLLYRHSLIVQGERICQAQNTALVVKMTAQNAAEAAKREEKFNQAKEVYEREIESNHLAMADMDAHPRIIRVCKQTSRGAVPAAPSSPADKPAGAGTLQEGGRADTVTDFDPAPVFKLLDEADQIVAECRRNNL